MDRKKDSIKKSYERITPFFYWLSKVFESKARAKSLDLSEIENGNLILIIAPPTEYYLDKLLELNSDGENHLMYFSNQLKRRAKERLGERYNYTASVGGLEKLPYENNKFDVIFAYCYLDFLEFKERKIAVEEIRRVLKMGGRLLVTYLASPKNIIERMCVSFFTRFDFLSKGARVVEVEPVLKQTKFKNIKILYCPQKGFPVGLAYAEK
ncbi:MAG: class I SAM-dependent methyltransferase [Candidatus Methanofastidiosia archaeon]